MTVEQDVSPLARTIFLSHAHADAARADEVAVALRRTGAHVRRLEWAASSGRQASDALNSLLAASDVIVVLLSPHFVESRWASKELSRSVEDSLTSRAIRIVPALIEECEVPDVLRNARLLDLRKPDGTQTLVNRLSDLDRVDFRRLAPPDFEDLVAALLRSMGFDVQTTPLDTAHQWDLKARYAVKGPFGPTTETWLVEIKQYGHDRRLGVRVLHELMARLAVSSADKCLVVTSSQLTSIARRFVADANRGGPERIKLLDGSELTTRLLEHPAIVDRFFGA